MISTPEVRLGLKEEERGTGLLPEPLGENTGIIMEGKKYIYCSANGGFDRAPVSLRGVGSHFPAHDLTK